MLNPPPQPIWIRIGQTTSQDLICDLGSPLRTFYKEDDRMTIHSAQGPKEKDDGCKLLPGSELLSSQSNIVSRFL